MNQEQYYLEEEEMTHLVEEMKNLFKMRIVSNKPEKSARLTNFLILRTLDLHELLTQILKNFSKNPYTLSLLCDHNSYLILYLIDFISEIKKETILSTLDKAKNKSARDDLAYFYVSSTLSIISCFDYMLRMPDSKQYLLEMIPISGVNKFQFRIRILEVMHLFETNFKNTDQTKLKSVCNKFIEALDAIKK
jgi:hypothetical protein